VLYSPDHWQDLKAIRREYAATVISLHARGYILKRK
jgi:hypothetical protein